MADAGLTACTTVTRSYLAHARVLARSFSAHHAGRRLLVLVTDDPGGEVSPDHEPFDVVRPTDLPLGSGGFEEMAARYDAKELATALKPWLLRHALGERANAVAFLDPDVEVFAPLDDVAGLAREHGIVLTPQTLHPVPIDGLDPTELDFERVGIYNTGFVAVSSGAEPFLDWLGARLAHQCHVDWERGLYVDQRFFDLVPAYFGHVVLRDAGFNVANWNLHERTLTQGTDGYLAAGAPLRFFHFSGFDPHHPDRLTRYRYRDGAPLRSERVAGVLVAALCHAYADRLLAAGYDECRMIGYPYGPQVPAARFRSEALARLLAPQRAQFDEVVGAIAEVATRRHARMRERLRDLDERAALLAQDRDPPGHVTS